jgi:FlaG/FlaF family flagellin (archaellin)
MKKILFIVVVMALTAPVQAELFNFSFQDYRSTYDSTELTNQFTVAVLPKTTGNIEAGSGIAELNLNDDSTTLTLAMTISAIGADTATGSGTFSFTDIDGDLVQGNIDGQWQKMTYGSTYLANTFLASLSDVSFTTDDKAFNGHDGTSASISGGNSWSGSAFELDFFGGWFEDGDFTTDQTSFHGTVVPIPAAVILGMLGLGVAGMRLRKHI